MSCTIAASVIPSVTTDEQAVSDDRDQHRQYCWYRSLCAPGKLSRLRSRKRAGHRTAVRKHWFALC